MPGRHTRQEVSPGIELIPLLRSSKLVVKSPTRTSNPRELRVPAIAEATRLARRHVSATEALRNAYAIDLNEGRLCARKLASRLLSDGDIETPSDVVMLTLEDLRTVYQKDPVEIREMVASRQEICKAFCAKEPPFVVIGELPAWETRPDRDRVLNAPESGAVSFGIPGSSGVTTGVARVVESPSELGEFQPADILVAPHTNPARSA